MPLDSLLHPTHSLFRRALVAAGAVEPLVHLANNATNNDAKVRLSFCSRIVVASA